MESLGDGKCSFFTWLSPPPNSSSFSNSSFQEKFYDSLKKDELIREIDMRCIKPKHWKLYLLDEKRNINKKRKRESSSSSLSNCTKRELVSILVYDDVSFSQMSTTVLQQNDVEILKENNTQDRIDSNEDKEEFERRLLRDQFHIEQKNLDEEEVDILRSGQRWVIDSLFKLQNSNKMESNKVEEEEGNEVRSRAFSFSHKLLVMGTGRGKSLTYLFPSLLWSKSMLTIVICPLVALIEDQIRALPPQVFLKKYAFVIILFIVFFSELK